MKTRNQYYFYDFLSATKYATRTVNPTKKNKTANFVSPQPNIILFKRSSLGNPEGLGETKLAVSLGKLLKPFVVTKLIRIFFSSFTVYSVGGSCDLCFQLG